MAAALFHVEQPGFNNSSGIETYEQITRACLSKPLVNAR